MLPCPEVSRLPKRTAGIDDADGELCDVGGGGLQSGHSEERIVVSSDLPQFGTEASVLGKSSQEAIWLEDVPSSAPWFRLRWDLFIPLVLVANFVVAILAWYVADLVMG
jgi:hypothetical protein